MSLSGAARAVEKREATCEEAESLSQRRGPGRRKTSGVALSEMVIPLTSAAGGKSRDGKEVNGGKLMITTTTRSKGEPGTR